MKLYEKSNKKIAFAGPWITKKEEEQVLKSKSVKSNNKKFPDREEGDVKA